MSSPSECPSLIRKKNLKKPVFLFILSFAIPFLLNAQSIILPYNSFNDLSLASGIVYDNGGETGNYKNFSNDTLVIRPDVPGKYINLAFNDFSINDLYDTLYIYSGTHTSSPLIRAIDHNPIRVYSTDASGALTLRFKSGGSETFAGFSADISLLDKLPDSDVGITSSSCNKDTLTAGGGLQIISFIRNHGDDTVYHQHLDYCLSADTTWDASDYPLDLEGTSPMEFVGITRLLPGQDFEYYSNVRIPINYPEGACFLLTSVMDANGNTDSHPLNNYAHSALYIRSAETDLSITGLSLSPNTLSSKIKRDFSYQVKNTGITGISSLDVGFYLSDDPLLDASDVLIFDSQVPYLASGEDLEIHQSIGPFDDDQLVDGIYYLIIDADYTKRFNETDESNNIFISQVLVSTKIPPDSKNLSITGIYPGADSVTVGERLFITCNIHANLAMEKATVRVYLSPDTILDVDRDVSLDYSIVTNLDQGENEYSSLLYFNLNENAGIDTGENHLIFVLDPENEIYESDESDNSAHASLRIINDAWYKYRVTDFQLGCDSILRNQTLDMSCVIQNLGTKYLGSPCVSIFLSEDEVFDTTDVGIRYLWSNMLHPGTSRTLSSKISFLDYPAGEYHLICVAGYEGSSGFVLMDEAWIVLPVKLLDENSIGDFDIEVLDLTVPAILAQDSPATLSFEYLLHHTEDLDVSFASYLSPDSAFSSDDLANPLFYEVYPTPAYQRVPISREINMSQVPGEGKYYVILKADNDNLIFGEDESNNLLIKALTLSSSPLPAVDLLLSEVQIDNVVYGQASEINGVLSLRNQKPYVADSVFVEARMNKKGFSANAVTVWRDTLYHIGNETQAANLRFSIPDTMLEGIYDLHFVLSLSSLLSDQNPDDNTCATSIGIQVSDTDYALMSVQLSSKEVIENSHISLSYQLINLGTTLSSSPEISTYLSVDTLYSVDDIFLSSVLGKFSGIEKAIQIEQEIDIPDSANPGQYHLLLLLDAKNTIPESSELNNNWHDSLEVIPSKQNLVIENPSLLPSPALPGAEVLISFNIRNTGEEVSSLSHYSLYFSSDTVHDPSDQLIRSYMFGGISPGEADTIEIYYHTNTELSSGPYYIIVEVDDQNEVSESEENDNTAYVGFNLIHPDFDLELIAVDVPSPMEIARGSSNNFTFSVRNNGTHTYPSNVPVKISQYLSPGSQLDLTTASKLEPYVNGHYLPAGQELEISLNLQIDRRLPLGDYYWFLELDFDQETEENNEDNNEVALPLSVVDPGVDLVIHDLETSNDTVVLNGMLNYTFTLENLGVNTTGQGFYCRFYISKDPNQNIPDYSFGSGLLEMLPGGDSITLTQEIRMPNDLEPGLYYLIAEADIFNDINESDEDNNSCFTTIYIESQDIDLVISAAEFFYDETRDYLGFTSRIENNGSSGTPGELYLAYYASDDNKLDANDERLTYGLVSQIAANSYIEETFYFTRLIKTGQYYILVEADYYNNIIETNESNNVSAFAITVPGDFPAPDLVFSDTRCPINEEFATFIVTITNTGDRTSKYGPECALYFSSDTLIDEEDAFITSFNTLALAPGESITVAYEMDIEEIPDRKILCYVDSQYKVIEANEENNLGVINLPYDINLQVETGAIQLYAGDTYTIESTLSNTGMFTSESFSLSYYLSENPTLDASGQAIHELLIEALHPDESRLLAEEVVFPTGINSGNYSLIIQANTASLNHETDAENNEGIIAVQILGNTGINDPTGNSDPEIQIFPNPVSNYFHIKSNQEFESFRIMNIQGQVIKVGRLNGLQNTIKTTGFSKGFYLLELNNRTSRQIVRFEVI